MAPVKVILLACGSFNPPTNMHLRMFEIARDHLHRRGNFTVIGGLVSPVHDAYGKKDLEPATHRLAMLKLALQSADWIKVSDWECHQRSWSRTRLVLEYHQNQVNALLHNKHNKNLDCDKANDNESWVPENVKILRGDTVQVKLLCGADLLESFGTPGLWKDEDIETIIGQHGLVVVTRSGTNPEEFIYHSDLLTKHMSNIVIVTEWIRNEISSTKIRRALRRSESVKYLVPEKVIDHIHKFNLYGSKNTKYLPAPIETNSNFIIPSPNDVSMDSPTPPRMLICNNSLCTLPFEKNIQPTEVPDNLVMIKNYLAKKLPGQAVKISPEDREIIKKEVNSSLLKKTPSLLSHSKSCEDIMRKKSQLKECKSCEENLIKFIFTKHGIQVISDVETIV